MPDTILVVDDDPDIAKFMQLTLEAAGFEVVVAHDGREALAKVDEGPPDLVLLDIMLPTIDGFEVANELRRRSRLTGMGIIVVSARGMPEDRLRGLSLGVDDYIVKPFEPAILLARVRAALRRLRQMRSLSPLTGLPGTGLIEDEIRRHLAWGDPFALLYSDLDNFKALNDTKGWDVGNRVILAAAQVVDEAVGRFGGPNGFVGHIGGDDLVALVPAACAEETAAWICRRFDEQVREFYSPEELERGFVESVDRRGEPVRYPLVAISIGIASTAVRVFERFGDIVAVATEMKRAAKRDEGSSYAVDRRTGH
jgi:diguanylate cyclase (GGDEF)-like protein